MKIAVVGPTHPYRGGLSHHTSLLCLELQRRHDVEMISFTRQYPRFLFPGKTDLDPSRNGVKPDNVRYVIDSMNPLTWFAAARRIASTGRELVIIPWWTFFWGPCFFTLIKLIRLMCRARIVVLCHNVLDHESRMMNKWLSRMVLSSADMVVAQSGSEVDRINEVLKITTPVRQSIHPIYMPFETVGISKDEARKRLGIDGKTILFFGFVRKYKGLDVLLKSMPEVLKRHQATLLVVGEFWGDKEDYFSLISTLSIAPNVRIVDEYVPNEDVEMYFAASDIVVQPYLNATTSAVSQLAYGFARPVVASRLGGPGDVVVDGVNGRLVPPGDVSALAAALAKCLQDDVLAGLEEQAGLVGRSLTWERLASDLVEP